MTLEMLPPALSGLVSTLLSGPWGPALEAGIMAGMVFMAAIIILEDYRHLEVREAWLITLIVLAAIQGIAFPAAGLTPMLAFGGGVASGAVTRLVQGCMARRTGQEALGSADVLLAVAGGLLLGPAVVGIWFLAFSILSITAWKLAPRLVGVRRLDEDGESAEVIPLCPPILLTGAVIYALLKLGMLDALDPVGLNSILQ